MRICNLNRQMHGIRKGDKASSFDNPPSTVCVALVTLVALVSLTLYTGSRPGKRGRSVTRKLLHAFVLLAGLSALAAAKDLQNLGGDGVAIQGYDPVAFFTDRQPVKGNPQFQSDYRGAKYYFASADHKAAV